MEIVIAVIVVIVVALIIAANSASGAERIEKAEAEVRRKNEAKFIQVINQEPNENARGFLEKAKEMFDNGDSSSFLDVYVKIGVPADITYSKNSEMITSYLGFEDEQANDLFNTYCLGLSERYDLQNLKLKTVDDVFEKHKLILHNGEVLFEAFHNIYCLQEKTIRKDVTYGGIRYGNGLFRGGHLSYTTKDIKTFEVDDYGKLFLTNKRIIFVGEQKNFTLSMTIGNILDYYQYKDGILLCRNNKKNVIFKESQFKNYDQSDDDYCFLLDDFPNHFISIIGRIANKTENQDIG